MASIDKRKNADGTFTYRVLIRKKNNEISKSFKVEEDAKLYAWYKEKLINNMDNFDVPIKDRVTLKQVIEMKIQSMNSVEKRTLRDMENSYNKLSKMFPNRFFLHEISFEDWKKSAENIYQEYVYKGAKTEKGKRKMAPKTLRRIFASISSAFSYAISLGIEIDNHPLKVIQTYINPMIKTDSID